VDAFISNCLCFEKIAQAKQALRTGTKLETFSRKKKKIHSILRG